MFNRKISPHSLVLRARCEQKLLNGESRGVDLSNCKNFCVILLLGVLCFIVEPLKMMRCQRGELKNEKRARQMHACKHTLVVDVFLPSAQKPSMQLLLDIFLGGERRAESERVGYI
jgi:hypothetical protein